MTGLSKCCGARVYEEADIETPYTEFYHREIYCSKCHKSLSKLNQGELLIKLKKWRNLIVKSKISYNWDKLEEQAYQQIKEIINRVA